MTQRWNQGRESYRPRGEPIDPRRYEVAEIDELTAKAFVLAHHYSGTYPAARLRVGLFELRVLVGVAVFSQPPAQAVLDILPAGRDEGVELGRLVLLDSVPANGETWFLRRAFAIARAHGFTGVIAHADPVRRVSVAGVVVLPGHVGTIYQALNGEYTGRARPRTHWILPSGQVYSERSITKVRAGDRGWRYAAEQLRAAGADAPGVDRAAWLAEWLPRICRRARHPGVHRYVWGLDRRAARALATHLDGIAKRDEALPVERRRVVLGLDRPKMIDLAA